MEQPSSDYIQMRFLFPFHSPVNYLGSKGLLPVLHLLETSGLPKPLEIEFSGKSRNRMRKRSIHSYLDPQLLAILEPIAPTGTLIKINATQDLYFSIYISQASSSDQMVIDIDPKIVERMGIEKAQKMFTDLVNLFPKVYFAQCCFVRYYSDFNRKYMDHSQLNRSNYFPFLVWLQYVGSQELIFQGGMSLFESNPLLRTTRLHDGLLVEVGDSPYNIFKAEGEALLVKATFSLPRVQYPSKA
jgi:hypothetical protein